MDIYKDDDEAETQDEVPLPDESEMIAAIQRKAQKLKEIKFNTSIPNCCVSDDMMRIPISKTLIKQVVGLAVIGVGLFFGFKYLGTVSYFNSSKSPELDV